VVPWKFDLALGEHVDDKQVENIFLAQVVAALNATSNFRSEVVHLQSFMNTAIFASINVA